MATLAAIERTMMHQADFVGIGEGPTINILEPPVEYGFYGNSMKICTRTIRRSLAAVASDTSMTTMPGFAVSGTERCVGVRK